MGSYRASTELPEVNCKLCKVGRREGEIRHTLARLVAA